MPHKITVICCRVNNDDNTIINPLEKLTNREMEVAERLIAGEPMKEISNNLNLHACFHNKYLQNTNLRKIRYSIDTGID